MQEPITVAQLNDYLKALIENDIVLRQVLVRGEVSNFKEYSVGGQWYFTLKDESSQINCVVFENFASKMKYCPTDGDKVIVRGKLGVFNKRGTYNIQVFSIEPEGIGALAKAFEQMKKKLEKEGLFDTEHKIELPQFPRKIAVLSSPEGAAVHDVIRVAQRRNPAVEILVIPTIVQGSGAVESIVRNIQIADQTDADVLILARGGGSLEDLWAFNEVAVARAIYAAEKPIVSAIGHEIDFTIADFVADIRASTPSAAAELVVPDMQIYQERLESIQGVLGSGLLRIVTDKYQDLDHYQERLQELFLRKYERTKDQLDQFIKRLEDLNPLAVMHRGYCLVEKAGAVVMSAKSLAKGDIISLNFENTAAQAEVLSKGKKKL